jgi:hypothetical protein
MQEETTGWAGWAAFAGFMMIMIGVFHVIAGLAGIINDDFYVLGIKYVFKLDATSWGWIHLLWGVVVLLAGFGVFKGAVWARTVGVMVAMISAIANFAFIPYYPVWSIIIITVNVLVIWALTVHGRELANP